ncbi:MAG: DNA methyltransferase [Luteibacter sp.]|uniref:DNA-methyltransferase n=1 Tax=Luteibacter sp. TaxID=1886636 RepID=UPI00280882E8|nr:DNA methyltransferase [Luteibacter sp.]MDQ7996107.1 DNA methyltransferase [Luteibacter sp.]
MTVTIHTGDCLAVMRTLADNSVDAVVTDPPYGLSELKREDVLACLVCWIEGEIYRPVGKGFMGKSWDAWVPGPEVWKEALRVLKPGGHMLAFAGTRSMDLMMLAIRLAGFEVRDAIGNATEDEQNAALMAWVYGSGFPKSHNGEWGGTALKPAWEPIVMARKPLVGTVAINFAVHGVGGLNIDACRVVAAEGNPSIARRQGATNHLQKRSAAESEADGRVESRTSPERYREERPAEELGRWPANVIHDGGAEVVAAFPDAPGQQRASRDDQRTQGGVYGAITNTGGRIHEPRGDSGSAARFFYCAKASKSDREAGMGDGATGKFNKGGNVDWDNPYLRGATDRRNHHPTVKPTELMRYLVRLVTPVGGVVLDPFMGSGSTGRGAALEDRGFVGIELDPEYAAIATARIADAERERADEKTAAVEAARQTDLFKEQAA